MTLVTVITCIHLFRKELEIIAARFIFENSIIDFEPLKKGHL